MLKPEQEGVSDSVAGASSMPRLTRQNTDLRHPGNRTTCTQNYNTNCTEFIAG
jgi:hypothetical protein